MRPNARKQSSIIQDVDHSFTVMLLGDSCTGKTCLLVRYNDGAFLNNNFISTVGVDYRNKVVDLGDKKVKLQIWDTAGQERFRSITSSYYRQANAILVVFDVACRQSFENVRNWISQIKEFGTETTLVTLVGNKCDLGSSRTVQSDEARSLAKVRVSSRVIFPSKAYSIPYIETSAKTGHNVNEAFMSIARRLVAAETGEKYEASAVVDLATSDASWSCCGGYSLY